MVKGALAEEAAYLVGLMETVLGKAKSKTCIKTVVGKSLTAQIAAYKKALAAAAKKKPKKRKPAKKKAAKRKTKKKAAKRKPAKKKPAKRKPAKKAAKRKPTKKVAKRAKKKVVRRRPVRPPVRAAWPGNVPVPKFGVPAAIGKLSGAGSKLSGRKSALRSKTTGRRLKRKPKVKPSVSKAARRMQLSGQGYLQVNPNTANPVEPIEGFPGMFAVIPGKKAKVRRKGVAVGKLPKRTRAGKGFGGKPRPGKTSVKNMTDKEKKKLRGRMMRL